MDELAAIGQVPVDARSTDMAPVSQWDEAFRSTPVAAAGNAAMARVHKDVIECIRIICRLDFTNQTRIDGTYDEHRKILKAVQLKRGAEAAILLCAHIETSQVEVHKITLHQVHVVQQLDTHIVG